MSDHIRTALEAFRAECQARDLKAWMSRKDAESVLATVLAALAKTEASEPGALPGSLLGIVKSLCRLALVGQNEALAHQVNRLYEAIEDVPQKRYFDHLLRGAMKNAERELPRRRLVFSGGTCPVFPEGVDAVVSILEANATAIPGVEGGVVSLHTAIAAVRAVELSPPAAEHPAQESAPASGAVAEIAALARTLDYMAGHASTADLPGGVREVAAKLLRIVVTLSPAAEAQPAALTDENEAFKQWLNHYDGNEAGMTIYDAVGDPEVVRWMLCAWNARATQPAAPAKAVVLPLSEERPDGAPTSSEERHLRRLLCFRVAGSTAYMDDGEASDCSTWPHIDFLRDSPADIERKLIERGVAKFAEQTKGAAS